MLILGLILSLFILTVAALFNVAIELIANTVFDYAHKKVNENVNLNIPDNAKWIVIAGLKICPLKKILLRILPFFAPLEDSENDENNISESLSEIPPRFKLIWI